MLAVGIFVLRLSAAAAAAARVRSRVQHKKKTDPTERLLSIARFTIAWNVLSGKDAILGRRATSNDRVSIGIAKLCCHFYFAAAAACLLHIISSIICIFIAARVQNPKR
uniref:Secreted protein n=1 Tax=Anopheles darlingi TaxID=43151 RepID=A0A2M4DNH7_ANODA